MTAFDYPAAPHVRRHGPQGYADVEGYRPWLRDEFDFRCVYCLFREQWGRVKTTFTLDHFRPVSVDPEHERSYENLLYACGPCNGAKGSTIVPDPTQVFTADALSIGEDGRLIGATRDSRRLIRLLGLNGREQTEARMLWIGIIDLAKRYDAALYGRLMSFPEDLPELSRLRPPSGNMRPEGLADCYHARKRRGALAATY
jgi:hypothetical protein